MIQLRFATSRLLALAQTALKARLFRVLIAAAGLRAAICASTPSAEAQVQPMPPTENYASPWANLAMQTAQASQNDQAPPGIDNLLKPQPAYTPPGPCADPCVDHECSGGDDWHSQVLPQGIIYQSYMAGTKEPRFATYFNQNSAMGYMWDVARAPAAAFGGMATKIQIGPRAGRSISKAPCFRGSIPTA